MALSNKLTIRNIYKFPLMKTDEEREMELDLIASRQDISAKQQSRVKQVTHDLVEWGKQLVSDHVLGLYLTDSILLWLRYWIR